MWRESKELIIKAHQRIKPYIHQTPIMTCQTIIQRTGCSQLFFKCENFQKIGAFKPRGAFNKILQLKNATSVCTHSSGNHAQGLAYAAKMLNIPAYIVMPENSSPIKKQAVEGYGATVITSGNTEKERRQTAMEVSRKYQAAFVAPYDDIDVILGQATVGKEVFEQIENLDYLLFPIGGGGLASGSCLSNRYFGNKCKTIGVEPYIARDAKESLEKGSIQPQYPPISIADGLRTNLGQLPFEILKELQPAEDVILVEEEDIVAAQRLVMERMKIVVEPSSATVVAALLKDQRFTGKKVCCILSGGNVDLSSFFDNLKRKIAS